MQPRVVLVHLGRSGGAGTWVRVESLRSIFTGAGAVVEEIRLRVDHKTGLRDLAHVGFSDLARGRTVPESMAWTPRSVLSRLESLDPAVVICLTSRAFHPILTAGRWRLVIDYIDRLSVSYRDRSLVAAGGPMRLLYRALAVPNRRFETAPVPVGVTTIAAGWRDSQDLHARWVPITVPLPSAVRESARHDLLFFGSLSYPPNIEAVVRLSRLWPAIEARRPGTTLHVAGSNPAGSVFSAVQRNGWSLTVDFPALNDLLASARLAVVPLEHASGIQIKVLEAAAAGRAQVISPVAAAGVGPDFPVPVASSDDSFLDHVVALLDDPSRCAAIGEESRAHIAARFTTQAWVPWAQELLDGMC